MLHITSWLREQGAEVVASDATLGLLAGDASHRRYYRVFAGDKTLPKGASKGAPTGQMVMDSTREPAQFVAFIKTAELFRANPLFHVPEVIAHDGAGLALLEDLGDTTFATYYETGAFADAVRLAIAANIAAQTHIDMAALPDYANIAEELALFPEYYLRGSPCVARTDWQVMWRAFCERVIAVMQCAPQGVVHRDYHCRNLMWGFAPRVGVLDFQDAVCGPVLYDAVSLLYDAYAVIPNKRAFLQPMYALGHWASVEAMLAEAEVIALHRALKILGIFMRLSLRDGKHGYRADIPKVYQDALTLSTAIAPELLPTLRAHPPSGLPSQHTV